MCGCFTIKLFYFTFIAVVWTTLVINTDILSRNVSELSQLIVQILDILHFWALLWRA